MTTYFDLDRKKQLEFLVWMEENHQDAWRVECDLEYDYDNMLDECYPDCQIAGYNYSTSEALKLVDPTAYRCGYADYTSDRYIEITTLEKPNRTMYLETDTHDELIEEFLEETNNVSNDGV